MRKYNFIKNFNDLIIDSKNLYFRDQLNLCLFYFIYDDLSENLTEDFKKTHIFKDFVRLILSSNLSKIKLKNFIRNNNKKLEYSLFFEKILFVINNYNEIKVNQFFIPNKNINKFLIEIDQFIPIIEKQDGTRSGYIALSKIIKNTKKRNINDLFLFKERAISNEVDIELYLVRFYGLIMKKKNSYKIFLGINKNFKSLNDSMTVIKILKNFEKFSNIIYENKLIRPKNLIKNIFIYGMIGNCDLNVENIIIKKQKNSHKFIFIDPHLANQKICHIDVSNKVIDLFNNFFNKSNLNNIDNLILNYKNIIYEYFMNARSIFLESEINNLEYIIKHEYFQKLINLMTNKMILSELIDIVKNCNFKKIKKFNENFKNFLDNHNHDNFECLNHYEKFKKNIQDIRKLIN